MKRILSILSTFLFALVLTLTSCTKENLRTSNECNICGTWKLDSIVVPDQIDGCGNTLTKDIDVYTSNIRTMNFSDKPGNSYQTNNGDTIGVFYVNYIDSDSINFTDTPYNRWTFSFKIQINSNKMTMTGLKHQNVLGYCDRTEIWHFTKN